MKRILKKKVPRGAILRAINAGAEFSDYMNKAEYEQYLKDRREARAKFKPLNSTLIPGGSILIPES